MVIHFAPFQVAAFSCSKFVFFLPHAFFCLKMLFFSPLHFFPHRLCVFSTSSFFTASKPFERASRFFTVHICLNPFNLLDFFIGKKLTLFRLFFTVPRIARGLNFCEVWKIDCSKTSLFISFQVFQKSKSLIAKIRFKKWMQFQF